MKEHIDLTTGTVSLAAMGFTFPIVMIVHSIAMGIGLGVSSCASRAIDTGNYNEVKHLCTYALILAFLVMSVITLLAYLMLPRLLSLLGAEDEAHRLAQHYLLVLFIFVPFAEIPMVGNNAIRATGDTLRPSIIMSVAAVLNVILDPMFIFGLGPVPVMGIKGAALATGLSRLFSLSWSLWLMHYRCGLLTRHWTGWRDMMRFWDSILHVGLPNAATHLFSPLAMGVVT